jgi:hypothetical protein
MAFREVCTRFERFFATESSMSAKGASGSLGKRRRVT